MFWVTLIYENGTEWFAGGFNTIDDAWAWIDEERTRPYWVDSTEVRVVDMTQPPPEEPPVEEPPTPPEE